jgi:hypothetical protein
MCLGMSGHILDEQMGSKGKRKAGSTFVLPGIRTLCLFKVFGSPSLMQQGKQKFYF